MELVLGDCKEKLKELDDNSIDAIVTDPPYGLSFMGKKWDYDVPSIEVWQECLRVLKPGGYLLSFAGTRTQHRMAVNIEDAGFEIRDMIAWVYGSGFPKSLNIGKSVNQLETNEWSKIGKALDNVDQKSIIEVWKSNSNNVKIVEAQSLKNQIIVGQDTPSENFVVLNVVQNRNQENSNLLVSFAEQNLNEAQAINTKINTALLSVETEIRQLQNNVRSVEQQSQNQNHKYWNIFTAQCDVKEWLNENTVVNHKVDEALKTLRGNKKYSNEEITSVLCAELTNILKLTILNQSKTFQSLDTNQKTECVSAINVIITEYTAENLISNTVAILKSKAVDKLQGNEREVVGNKEGGAYSAGTKNKGIGQLNTENKNDGRKTLPERGSDFGLYTKGNSQYEGWGTALKPALEPITVARKPLGEKTVAENCLKWGVGGINIDGCRVDFVSEEDKKESTTKNQHEDFGTKPMTNNNVYGDYSMMQPKNFNPTGRFPANLIHDGSDEVVGLFPQTKGATSRTDGKGVGMFASGNKEAGVIYPDSGSASRFFYCAKASKRERNIGCEGLETSKKFTAGNYSQSPTCKTCDLTLNGTNDHSECSGEVYYKEMESKNTKNNHPTVKPIALMEYLVKLVSREGQVVLDPFMGSGTTGMACKKLDREFIGIEMMPEYMEIAKARIDGVKESKQLEQLNLLKDNK